MKTWCPNCKKIVIADVKDYYLLGEKRRKDFFCSNCKEKVIPECLTSQEYNKKRVFTKLKDFGLLYVFLELFFIPISLILCIFFSIIFWDRIRMFSEILKGMLSAY